jgi:hypothetical protein
MNDFSYTEWHAMADIDIQMRIGNFVQHHRLKQNKTQNDKLIICSLIFFKEML